MNFLKMLYAKLSGAGLGSNGFEAKAVMIMGWLIRDLQLSSADAAAILGNLGHETGGFVHMQELNPISGRGGYGWAQWTGPRRIAFESWARANNLQPSSDAANYGFLLHELRTTEANAISALRAAQGVDAKTIAFEKKFERAGVKNYPSRISYAKRALAAFGGGQYTEQQSSGGAMQATLIPGFSFGGLGTIGTILLAGAALYIIYQIATS